MHNLIRTVLLVAALFLVSTGADAKKKGGTPGKITKPGHGWSKPKPIHPRIPTISVKRHPQRGTLIGPTTQGDVSRKTHVHWHKDGYTTTKNGVKLGTFNKKGQRTK
jgi:hypothetical protein